MDERVNQGDEKTCEHVTRYEMTLVGRGAPAYASAP
jgi:hypothetical protein